jgi:acyl-coenzyme A synthetase/AMP-(fatty) acid ligase
LMTGAQMSAGYLEDAARTDSAFVRPPGQREVFYRTGDRVRRPAESGAPLKFLGRADTQVKVRGFRIEVGEVEAALCDVARTETAVVIPWPRVATSFAGLVGFVVAKAAEPALVMRELREILPEYMMPSEVRVLSEFPLNSNGKIDRRELTRLLEESSILSNRT